MTRIPSVLLSNVGIHLLVIPAGILFLSFSKWYVVCDAANPGMCFGIFLSYFDRNTDWHRCNAARPIKFNISGANVLLGFLHGISRIPSRVSSIAKPDHERQCKNT